MNPFEYKIFKHCIDKGLLKEKDRIIVSYSGGVDSTALLYLMLAFKTMLSLEILVVHFNHDLRLESLQEEYDVHQSAIVNKLPIVILKKNKKFKNKSIQFDARVWRRKELVTLKNVYNFTKIVTGHHIEDLSESQLWRIARGGSLFTLDSIKANEADFVRPLLSISKKELKDYITKKKINWSEDLSNKDNKYVRNRIRNVIIPELEVVSGGTLFNKLKGLADDAVLLNDYFIRKYAANLESPFLKYDDVIKAEEFFGRELIHRFLIKKGVLEIKREIIIKIFQLIFQKKNNWSLNLHGMKKAKGLNFQFFIECVE